MRILMCNSFYYMRGGAERCVLELSSLLEKKGHEVIPFAMSHEKNLPSKYSNYFVSYIDYPSLLKQKTDIRTISKVIERDVYSHEAKEKIIQLIKDTKPDIAHVHGYGHELSPSILDGIKSFRIPIVQTLHDYGLLCPNTSFISQGQICERCKVKRYYNVVLYRCKRNSLQASTVAGLEKYYQSATHIFDKNIDIFISPSKYLKQKMIEYGWKQEIVLIPNFINIERFQPNYSPSDYYVFSGRLVEIKGLYTLLESAKQNRNIKLFIAGDGEIREPLQQMILENQLSNVVLLGHLDSSELIKLISGAAFTVMPSEWYENYPMSIIEAFACGKSVIASNLGAIPDLVKDNWNGLLFEAGNSTQLAERIKFLFEHQDKAAEMGMNGRKEVETINNPEEHYQRTMQTYQHILEANGSKN